MYITNSDFYSLVRAIGIISSDTTRFQELKSYQRDIVLQAEKTLAHLDEKKKNDNKRQAKYMAEKRKINKNYGR